MEKYSQFRDRGTAIAPFFPASVLAVSPIWTPIGILLFVLRIPILISLSLFYFVFLQWLPVGSWFKKFVLWAVLAVPGVWWVDLQVDGVKRGKLAAAKDHLPAPGSIIAASFTSPLDPLYLAAIFKPVFTRSYPATREVEEISFFRAILMAFAPPTMTPPNPENLISIAALSKKYPEHIIAVFPECTTTNGRGILPLSSSLLSADPHTKIFPVNLRYTPADITTPVPGGHFSWLWRLCSSPSHAMRVRIAECVYNSADAALTNGVKGAGTGFDTNIFDSPRLRKSVGSDAVDEEDETRQTGELTPVEKKVLDRVGEDLARLGRVKRVGLGVQEKVEFVKVWTKRRR